MKKTFSLVNLFLILAVIVGDVFYTISSEFWIKIVTSIGFVLIGVVNLIYVLKNNSTDKKFAIIMLVGLFFAMLGDVVLEIEFIVGAALFAVGHVFYFIAYCFLEKFRWIDLLVGAIIFVPSVLFITLAPIFDFGGVLMEVVCIVYAIIISCMLGKSISNFIKKRNILYLILMIGSFLFIFSDLMLLLRLFAGMSEVVRVLCMATYYPAECLLAYSFLWTRNCQSEETDKKNKFFYNR